MLCRQNLLLGLFLVIVGALVTFWPEKIHAIGIRSHDRDPKLAALNPFSDLIRRPSYRLVISGAGVVLICFFRRRVLFCLESVNQEAFPLADPLISGQLPGSPDWVAKRTSPI